MLAKSKLNSIAFLISKVLIDSNIIHEEFILLNNGLKEFYDMKDEIKNYIDKYKFYNNKYYWLLHTYKIYNIA